MESFNQIVIEQQRGKSRKENKGRDGEEGWKGMKIENVLCFKGQTRERPQACSVAGTSHGTTLLAASHQRCDCELLIQRVRVQTQAEEWLPNQ